MVALRSLLGLILLFFVFSEVCSCISSPDVQGQTVSGTNKVVSRGEVLGDNRIDANTSLEKMFRVRKIMVNNVARSENPNSEAAKKPLICGLQQKLECLKLEDQDSYRALRGEEVAYSADYRSPRHHPPKNN